MSARENGDSLQAEAALAALEFASVLEIVAGHAAGPLGRAAVLARRPSTEVVWIAGELETAAELARLERKGKGVVPEPVPALDSALGRLRISGSVLEGDDLLAVRRTVTAARLVAAELARVAPDAPRASRLAQPLPDRAVERRLTVALDDDGQLLDAASPALAGARSEIRSARTRLIQKLEGMLRAVGGEGAVTVRNGRYVIPVPRELRGRPDGIVHGESASGATLFIEPSAAIPFGNALREAELAAEREALKVYRELTELARPERERIATVHAMCVAVDELVARARYAAAVEGEAPEVGPAPAPLRIVNGRHPLLLAQAGGAGKAVEAEMAGGREGGMAGTLAEPPSRRAAEPPTTVPFDLDLEPGERTLLISGPNTGGKSVLLKAVGLCAALAQSGIIPPIGPGSRLPVFHRIFADIGDRQSIAASLSTFSAHVAVLRSILHEADDATLVLLDEIGSGTDPAEGAALAGAALLSLTRRGTTTLATTHLGALKQLASRAPGIVNASLQFNATTLEPSYRFLKGVPGRSYGLAIARRLGLPEDVLGEAEAQVPDAERTLDALLASVEEREREQGRREVELAAQYAENTALRARLETQSDEQEAREEELRVRERNAERAAREQSRSFLLDARRQVDEAIAKAREAGDEASGREARRMVEEAVRIEREELERLGGSAARRLGHEQNFEPGSRVRLDSGTVGTVIELRSDERIVVQVGSLKVVVNSTSLTAAEPPSRRAAESRGSPAEPPSRRGAESRAGSAEPPSRRAAVAPFEVDLRGLTGDEAEQSVLSALDAAVLAEHPYLRIIHGKGTGVVRERVQRIVAHDRRVKHHAFAPSNQGGTGVTVVEFEA